jgi:hypothetical protein
MTYSRGRVKFPIGGNPDYLGKPASALFLMEVSRSGENPEPTVTVRMEENRNVYN